MKRKIYLLFCLPVFLLLPVRTIAQASCDGLDFTIAGTAITNSTCLSNGTITVTLSNVTSNVSSIQYGLNSTTGFTINPQSSNVLQNIPPGTYSLLVRAFCAEDSAYSVVKTTDNLVVGGTYKVTQASFNAASSRKSYSNCGTGIIALNVTDGSGNFTFNVVSAPSDTLRGPVTPTKNGNVYTLPGQNWPAGDYQISIDDGCYTAIANFTLSSITGFPVFQYENYQGFLPDIDNTHNSCSFVGWNAYSADIVNNSDYAAYFNAGMYEIGIAPAGTDVSAVTNWTTWTTNISNVMGYGNMPGVMYFDLSPNTISNFYSKGNYTNDPLLTVFLRVKGCQTTYKSFSTSITPPMASNPSFYCDYIKIASSYNCYAVFCYPLDLTIKTATDSLLYEKKDWYSTDAATQIPFDYDGPIKITFTGADNSFTATTSISPLYANYFYYSQYCNYYSPYWWVTNSTASKPVTCYTWSGILTVTDQATGSIIGTDTIFSDVNAWKLSSDIQMQYNKDYTVVIQDPNGTSESTKKNMAKIMPDFTFQPLYNSPCTVNYGYLSIGLPQTARSYFSPNTTFTATGPAGYTSQTVTISSATTPIFPNTILPPGQYTITYNLGGSDCKDSVTAYNPGLYNYSNFGYTSRRTCSGMDIMPTGNMTYQGTNTTTYFRLTNGPTGYEKKVISQGDTLTLSTPGTYTLGISYTNGVTDCAIATDTIKYTADPLSLDANLTAAYVCEGATSGDISVKAINGVTPYIYELWNADNTVQLIGATSSDSTVLFEYGEADSTYTVRVSDQCGSHFSQQVTLFSMHMPHIIYSTDNNNTVCQGGKIELRCLTLGTTSYEWTGPNGYASTGQNLMFDNVDSSMNGMYRVKVKPEFCGAYVEDSIYIQVFTVATDTAAAASQEICVAAKPLNVLNSGIKGGSGVYTYQWQSSADGVSGWADIPGATAATYMPSAQPKSGVYYYRCTTTDVTCGTTVNGNVMMVVVKGCAVPVNPNIRSLPK